MRQNRALSAFFICLLLFIGAYSGMASAMEVGPFEISRYEGMTAFRMGNIAFWLETRTLLMQATIMGALFAVIGIMTGAFIFSPITVPFSIIVGETIYLGFTIARQFPNAYGSRNIFEAYMTSPLLSKMSTAEFFYWLNMRAAGAPLPREIADAFNPVQ